MLMVSYTLKFQVFLAQDKANVGGNVVSWKNSTTFGEHVLEFNCPRKDKRQGKDNSRMPAIRQPLIEPS